MSLLLLLKQLVEDNTMKEEAIIKKLPAENMKKEVILDLARIQFITHYTKQYSYFDSARIAIEGGCRWIQLRMKEASLEEIRPIALKVKELCAKYGAVFIIDDHVELAKEIMADGVHLGKTDMPVEEARCMLDDSYIIGGTANTFEDIQKLYAAGADYIGCGPFRYTTTKKNLSPILGLDGYKEITHKMKAEGIAIPVVAIGGITTADIPAIMETEVNGIALSGTILRADNPVEEMKRILSLMKLK